MHPSQFLLACVYLMSAWAVPAYARTAQASFSVSINVQPANTALCRSAASIGIFGAAVTVICTTGAFVSYAGNNTQLPWATVQDSAYRFVTNVSASGDSLGTVDSYTGAGTVTSWRVIKLANRDYLEMMVHW